MGTGKKEKTRKEKQGKPGDGMANVKVKGENFYRTGKQAKTLSMFKDGKVQRNASGKVTKAASFQSREKPKARVEPNRKWCVSLFRNGSFASIEGCDGCTICSE